VDGKVGEPWTGEGFPVDLHFLSHPVDACAELADHLAVNLHPAFNNELFRLAAAGDAGGGKQFLQPFASGRVRIAGRSGGRAVGAALFGRPPSCFGRRTHPLGLTG
jgi:hypothetical protein